MSRFGYYGALSVVLACLKVVGIIDWPWLVVLLPVVVYSLVPVFLFWLAFVVVPWVEQRGSLESRDYPCDPPSSPSP